MDKSVASMTPQPGYTGEGARPFGYFEKSEKPGPQAVFVSGAAEVLDGPHAGSAKYAEGFLAVRIPGKNPEDAPKFRSVASDAISYCYQLADGTKIVNPVNQLPTVNV